MVLIELYKNTNYEISQEGNDIIAASLDDLKPYSEIEIACNVLLVGFPTSLIIDNFFDLDRPLLRAGIIAGIDHKSKTFIIDSPAFYGNSGGPVLQLDNNGNFHIIGIVSKYVPFVTEWKNKHEKAFSRQEFYNSGYAICVPLDEIIEIVKV